MKPITWFVDRQVKEGKWRKETVPTNVLGTRRPITIYRAPRRSNLIKFDWHGDRDTFCPPMWYDLAIGSGACGFACRACFLMLTFRILRDPWSPLIYDNVEDFEQATRRWLLAPERRPQHTLGLGIDCSDSLLYEGVTGHARRLIPLFANPEANPRGCNLILLTKSANTHYLDGLPIDNVVVSFSLNPEPIADLWEGVWPCSDCGGAGEVTWVRCPRQHCPQHVPTRTTAGPSWSPGKPCVRCSTPYIHAVTHGCLSCSGTGAGERVTPPVTLRVEAARGAQRQGFEVRFRIDPILTPEGWEEYYEHFFQHLRVNEMRPSYITLGTYREKNPQLDTWREKWGLPPMEWEPPDLVRDGSHWHLQAARRTEIYATVTDMIRHHLPDSRISLCKETHNIRRDLALCNAHCNCLR